MDNKILYQKLEEYQTFVSGAIMVIKLLHEKLEWIVNGYMTD